jgi:hypothetical protein
VSERCCELSEAAGEPLAATAVTARRWLLLEVPGAWPRDVSMEGALPTRAQAAVAGWLSETPYSRLQFVRRPGRVAARLRAFLVTSEETHREVRSLALDGHDDLARIDLDGAAGELVERSLVLVCGHGTRDRCCALRGADVFRALGPELGEPELWISSHQGGHRFAANVLVLPSAVQLGRVESAQASRVVRSALGGRISLEHYRGRTCYEPAVQAAEHAIRNASGLDDVDDLNFEAHTDDVVTFRDAAGREWQAVVEETAGPAVPASCGAEPEPQRAFSALVL